jgi:sporulation protein YlmC with PRC-barrel domain
LPQNARLSCINANVAREPAIRREGYCHTISPLKEATMNCRLVALAAASTLTLSVALAQSPAPSAGAADNANATAHAAKVIDQQKPDEWLASKFKGTDVLGADGTKVGSVDDVLFDRNGQIKAIVVGVGGFLGIGSKDVALEFNNFQVIPGKDGTADQLTPRRYRGVSRIATVSATISTFRPLCCRYLMRQSEDRGGGLYEA